ncbi:MAG: bifunctional enoyl-CoA hydratase/phosphate acetyltransferase, partial [Anaerolineae bacterium]
EVKGGDMAIRTLDEMVEEARRLGPKTAAVAAAADPEVLVAMDEAEREGLAHSILVGDAPRMERLRAELGLTLAHAEVVHEPDVHRAAAQAVALARAGRAQIVVKGQLKTSDLLGVALDRERGLRDRHLLAHVGVFEVPGFDRLLYISDSGVVLYPDIYQKLEILRMAVDVAHRFGLREPKVAILSASELVHPKMRSSVEALALAKMAEQGWVEGAVVEGPLTLDVAVSPAAAAAKGVEGAVAGQADLLIVPGVEAGNTMAKAIQYFGEGRMAGLVVGAKVPIIINSRADTAETRFLSLAMAVILAP